jgi:hypothetical protein
MKFFKYVNFFQINSQNYKQIVDLNEELAHGNETNDIN